MEICIKKHRSLPRDNNKIHIFAANSLLTENNRRDMPGRETTTGERAGAGGMVRRAGAVVRGVYRFYADGFRGMTLGRTLWAVIIIKLIIIFAVLKVFFFPDFLKANAGSGAEADFVAGEMERRVPAAFDE